MSRLKTKRRPIKKRRRSHTDARRSPSGRRSLAIVAAVGCVALALIWGILRGPASKAERRLEELRPLVGEILGEEIEGPVRVETLTDQEFVSRFMLSPDNCSFGGHATGRHLYLTDKMAGISGDSEHMDPFLVHHLVHVWQEQHGIPKLTRGAERKEVGKVRRALREGQAILMMGVVNEALGHRWDPQFFQEPDEDGNPHPYLLGQQVMAMAMSEGRSEPPWNAEAARRLLDEPPATLADLAAMARGPVAETEARAKAR